MWFKGNTVFNILHKLCFSAFNISVFTTFKDYFLTFNYVHFQEFNPDGGKIPSKNLQSSSSSVCTPQGRRLSVSTTPSEIFEEVEEISTTDTRSSISPIPSVSTVSKQPESFIRRTSPRKRKPESSTPLSTCTSGSSSTSANKRVCLFKEESTTKATYWLEKFEIPSKWEPVVQVALEKGVLTVEHKNALTRQLCTSIHMLSLTQ